MLESKVNQKNTHAAIAATIDPFEALERMGDEMRPRTPCPGAEGIPFDAEILYARRAAENNRHPEISRIETKFGKTITGYLYRTERDSVALQCDTDGFKSVLQTGVSFEALLTLPNLREPCKVVLIPDTAQFIAHEERASYVVDPDKGTCGCQIIFKHDFECRHLKVVYKYQAENIVECAADVEAHCGQTGDGADGRMPLGIRSRCDSTLRRTPSASDSTETLRVSATEAAKAPLVRSNANGKHLQVEFQKKTPADYPKAESAPETPVVELETKIEKPTDAPDETPSATHTDVLSEMVAKHHPTSLAALETNEKQETVYCVICNRELTNPTSRRTQLGPVCREKVGLRGEAHVRENIVSEKLLSATRIYKDAKFQQWILQGCLQLDAPVPKTVIKQKKTEYWGLKRTPYLYYLSKDNKVHCIYKSGKELKYKRITASSRDHELDQMAWREAKKYIDNGGKKPPRTILL